VFVGKGDLKAFLKHRARQLGLQPNVAFLGWRDDVQQILPLLDVLVLPSLNEGMGRVLVEAMIAGRPVVASRTGGIPDLIRDGVDGLLVPPGDASALADAILALIQNPQRAREMGMRGELHGREFGLPAMVEKIDGLYDALWENRMRRGPRPLPKARLNGEHRPDTLSPGSAGAAHPEARNPQPETEGFN
jgi:glycosyltransferase involved in cell wall biosynthesis